MTRPKHIGKFWIILAELSQPVRLAIFAVVFVAYWVAYPYVIQSWGQAYRVLALLYILLASLLWGFRGGLISTAVGVAIGWIFHLAIGMEYLAKFVGPALGLVIAGLIGHLRDLSLQLDQQLNAGLAARRDLEAYKNSLEELVEKRTREMSRLEKRLFQARKMEAIGVLAGGIAHDFNNILSAIIGYAELIQMELDEKSQASSHIREILQAGTRAKDLVQQILTFSRQTEQKLTPVAVNLIVKETLKLMRASLPVTIDIKQAIESDALIMGDPTQIHQVIMNLCTNAAQAMQEGNGTLEVELTSGKIAEYPDERLKELEPGTYLQLKVSDTGHGIPPEILDNIFDPFFTTKERGKGTGMGLAVVHGIVKSYGGTITVDSNPHKGSVFRIFLPTTDGNSVAGPIEEQDSLPEGNEHILFIDDEPALVEIGEQLLENLGYQVVTRTGSLEALELFRQSPDRFDLVITDMTMPGMTGERLAQEMLAINKNIPIIICTGFSQHMSESRAGEMGIQGFLKKPVVLSELAYVIRKTLDKTGGAKDQ